LADALDLGCGRRKCDQEVKSSAPGLLLTLQDVAEQCACSYWTVREWLNAGKLRVLRLPGRLVRVEPSEFDAFLERCRLNTGRPSNTIPMPKGGVFTLDAVALMFGVDRKTVYNVLSRHRDRLDSPIYWRRRHPRRLRVLTAPDVEVLRSLFGCASVASED